MPYVALEEGMRQPSDKQDQRPSYTFMRREPCVVSNRSDRL